MQHDEGREARFSSCFSSHLILCEGRGTAETWRPRRREFGEARRKQKREAERAERASATSNGCTPLLSSSTFRTFLHLPGAAGAPPLPSPHPRLSTDTAAARSLAEGADVEGCGEERNADVDDVDEDGGKAESSSARASTAASMALGEDASMAASASALSRARALVRGAKESKRDKEVRERPFPSLVSLSRFLKEKKTRKKKVLGSLAPPLSFDPLRFAVEALVEAEIPPALSLSLFASLSRAPSPQS